MTVAHGLMNLAKIISYRIGLFPSVVQLNSPLKRIEVAEVLAASALAEDDVLLDLCCGSGLPGQLFAKRVGRVIGVDLDGSQVGAAEWHRTYSRVGHKIDLVRSDVHSIPLPDGSVDVVISVCAIEHLANAQTVCEEVRRVLRPDGIYALTVDSLESVGPDFPIAEHAARYRVVSYYSVNSLSELLESAGFSVQHCSSILRSQRAVDELRRSMSSRWQGNPIRTAYVRWRIGAAERATASDAPGLFILAIASKPEQRPIDQHA